MVNNRLSRKKRRWRLFFQLLVLVISLGFYSLIFYKGIWTDLQGHIYQLQEMLEGRLIRANFIYYLLIYLVGLGQNNFYVLGAASIIVVSFAMVAKYRAAVHYFEWPLHPGSQYTLFAIIGAFLLVFASNLPGPDHYFLGQINPNVWHNSTTILLMPVAIILFTRSYQFFAIGEPNRREAWILTGLAVLSILIKPSFFFCFAPVFPLFVLMRFGVKRSFWWAMLPVVIGGIVLAGQYYLIFRLSPSLPDAVATEASGVQIAPFLVWGASTSNYIWSLISSLLFPLTFLICFPQFIQKTSASTYAWVLFLVAMVIFILVAETGDRALHGNFAWQAVVCSFMLFMVTVRDLLKLIPMLQGDPLNKVIGWRVKVCLAVFLLHVIAGVVYLGKILITGSYY